MGNARIAEAAASDRDAVLEFCRDTFSWGDYVEYVWDHWIGEGNLLVYRDPDPVGICHAFASKTQLWIEGIRVSPGFRRQRIASEMIRCAEQLGANCGASSSFMLVETGNLPSLNMADSAGYGTVGTWNFYSLSPKPADFSGIEFGHVDLSPYPMYVDSWRWLYLDGPAADTLSKDNRIVRSGESLAVLADSAHFEDTLIVTVLSYDAGSGDSLLKYIQNFAMTHGHRRIQVLAEEGTVSHHSLEYRMAFCLLEKNLPV